MGSNSIVFFGSPLIDIIVKVDRSFLNAFKLKTNDAVAINDENEIFCAIRSLSPKYVVGGCALNSARILKHVSNNFNCTVIGAVGDDEYSNMIKTQLTRDGVNYIFATAPKTTGRCAVLLNNEHRSLCTDLGASKLFAPEHLSEEEVWNCLKNGRCVYIPGFFLSVSLECVLTISQHTDKKIFAFNLSAPFIVELYAREIYQLLPNVDILFGNEAEARALAAACGFQYHKLSDVLKCISALNRKNKSIVIVITRGSKSVYTVRDGRVRKHRVTKLDETKIKDTTAAGDAFVGGFLGSFIMGKSLDVCVSSGINIAQTVIQYNGCWFEDR
ncbi:hypothetical protein FQR65_LT13582 [Abscondita terminalis]|nr:hypothetical protein FQR65_LT13582 [Abscondita terminalis]